MQVPKTYRVTISDLESIYGMSANPLEIEGSEAYIICHPQLPNSQSKKMIAFTDKFHE